MTEAATKPKPKPAFEGAVVRNTTTTAVAISGVLLKPGETRVTAEQFDALKDKGGFQRRIALGNLICDRMEIGDDITACVKKMAACDSMTDLQPWLDHEDEALRTIAGRISRIFLDDTRLPAVKAAKTGAELKALWESGPTPEGLNPAFRKQEPSTARHPIEIRVFRKRAKELNVRLPGLPKMTKRAPMGVSAK